LQFSFYLDFKKERSQSFSCY